MNTHQHEIAATAARMVVEEGLDFGSAKRRAVKQLGLPPRTSLPDNEQIEREVEDYIAIFCPDTQPAELRTLRTLALQWMDRLNRFHPHISGAVWHGTATQHSDIYLQLFCEDSKAAELELINQHIEFEPRSVTGLHGDRVEALSIHAFCAEFRGYIGIHLLIYDLDDVRGALKPDTRGRKPRGNAANLRQLLDD
ncbi:MAG: hypothetical protein RIR79_2354 [Pseudomonadota bacterium]|jgi:hypothetical protein